MASTKTKALLPALQRLALAYPDRTPDSVTLATYLESVSDIPPWLFRRAVESHIRRSPWFPKIADLRQIAAELAGIADPADCDLFAMLPPYPCDYLTAQVVALEDAFYQDGALDHREWLALCDQLERANRPQRAQAVREKLERLEQLVGEPPQVDFAEDPLVRAGSEVVRAPVYFSAP